MNKADIKSSDQDAQNQSTEPRQLATSRAVFRPRINPEAAAQAQAPDTARVGRITDESSDLIIPSQRSEYRVSLFTLGREEMIAAFPEQSEIIEQFTDLQVEELAILVEEALVDFFQVSLRTTLVSYLSSHHTVR